MTDLARPSSSRASRREGTPPPLNIWLFSAATVIALWIAAALTFLFVETPMPNTGERKFYEQQFASLDSQKRTLTSQGKAPLTVVFIGTSRLKNVVSDVAQVTRAASNSGVRRPVVSTHLAIYWGGFERFKPAIDLISKSRPDVIVIMPEFFLEDFNYMGRIRIGFRYLLTSFWGQEFTLFGDREFNRLMCDGFDEAIESRLFRHEEWIMDSSDSGGPQLARQLARKLAEDGTLVIIADVPVTRRMASLRPPVTAAQFRAKSGIPQSKNIRTMLTSQSFPDSDYCDWAHLNPERAGNWQKQFFAMIAEDLNRLPTQ